jgi:hypothetical protein
MATEPPASADPTLPDVRLARRRRRRAAAAITVLTTLLVWPSLLDSELGAKRIDTLRVLGPVASQGAGVSAPGASRHTPRISPGHARTGLLPNFGALREGPMGLLTADAAPPARPAALTGPAATDLVTGGLGPLQTANPAPGFGPPPIFPTMPSVGQPDPSIIYGPVPSPGGPPVTPPVVIQPVVTPPGTPPVVTPPDQPPVVPPEPPPIVSPPSNPPPDGPGPGTPPVILNPDPGTGCGLDPCGSGPGGGGPGPNPVSGAPEPALWLQIVLGTGLLGAAMRRRRRLQLATALRARSRA